MAYFALVDPSDTIVRTVPEHRLDRSARTKPGYRWLPVESVTDDRSTGPDTVRSRPVDIVEAKRVARTITIRDMTDQEKDAQKTSEVDGVDRLIFRALLAMENRIRALESRPSITAVQLRAALKRML